MVMGVSEGDGLSDTSPKNAAVLALPDYLMVLPVRHFRTGAHRVAIESAFAEHLRMLRSKVSGVAGRLVIASPAMKTAAYEKSRAALTVIDESSEGISFKEVYSDDLADSPLRRASLIPAVTRSLREMVSDSVCVHSGGSADLWLPFELIALTFGILQNRRTVFVVDIDYRRSAYMSYRTGAWSLKSYLLTRCLYDTVRSVQVRLAARCCSLALLKGKDLAADFGRGRPNVRDFLDASHSKTNLISEEGLAQKLKKIENHDEALRLVYFGRLVAYKGIDRCIRAVAAARRAGANVILDIIGGGEEELSLKNLARELEAGDFVAFHPPRQFDQEFFRFLQSFHVLLAAPLREDTPRSALDAMAAGISFLAFDTYYYRQLAEYGAGEVVPWLDEEAFARGIFRLAADRGVIAERARKAVAFAAENTQEIWLDRRFEWTFASPGDNRVGELQFTGL